MDLVVFHYADIVDGIHEALEKSGYHFILTNLRFKRSEEQEKPELIRVPCRLVVRESIF